MASTDKPRDDLTKKARHEKLEAIIRDRLGLGEEWFAITSRPSFFDEIEQSRLKEFENAFGQMIKLGCKWEVVLACLLNCHTYNRTQRIVRAARYDSVGELSHLPEKVWEPVARPPDRDKRDSISANFKATITDIENYEDLLSALGRLNPPPTSVASVPTSEDDMLDLNLTSDQAVLYLQKLLKWCRKLLGDDSLGNFSTVESVGQLIPCVYIEVVSPRVKQASRLRLPLKPVADLLNAISRNPEHTQDRKSVV